MRVRFREAKDEPTAAEVEELLDHVEFLCRTCDEPIAVDETQDGLRLACRPCDWAFLLGDDE